jgi:hypothetical protein
VAALSLRSSCHSTTRVILDRVGESRSVGEIIDENGSESRRILDNMELGSVFGDDESICKRLVGGGKCDCCGKKRNEVEGGLFRCTRCRLAYYCSHACQHKQWRAGHRTCCRTPDDIKAGDKMIMRGLKNRPELNSQFADVVRSLPRGRWAVTISQGDGVVYKISVTPDKLRHLRPDK